MDGISKETFEQMDVNSKLNVLFDYAEEAIQVAKDLDKKIEKRKKFDTVTAAAMGFLGGIVAHLGQLTLFHK